MGRLRRLGVGILVLACFAGLALLFRPAPLQVDVARVTVGTLERTVEEDGRTRVSEHYVVAAPVAGTLHRVDLKAGDLVDKGTFLAALVPNPAPMLDPRTRQELEQRLGAAEAAKQRTAAAVARVTATVAQARADLERTRILAARGVVAQSKLEHDELVAAVEARLLDVARFEDHIAEHEIEFARAALSATPQVSEVGQASAEVLEIRAPVQGHVLRVLQKSEAPVVIGTPLLEIGDVTLLEVVADILSTDAVAISAGAPVRIERWGGPGVLEGRVQRVEPSGFTKISALGVEEQRTNVVIDILTPLAERAALGDGYRVDVHIVVQHVTDALKLPTSALFREGEQWMVFSVVNGVARKTPIGIGLRTPQETEVTEGLQLGDVVVAFPGDALRDGMRVTTDRP